MLPNKSDPRWLALLTGATNYKFSNAAVSMLMFQLKSKVRTDNANIAQHVAEMHTFFTKYENVLKDDIKVIFK